MKLMKNRKLLLKMLSGLVAIILWIAITYTEDPIISQPLMGIGITFTGEDVLASNGLTIINKSELPDISVVIRGSRSNVISALGTISAEVDVSGIKSAGSSVVPIKYNYPSVGIILAKAKTVELTIETEKITSRNIPVVISVENQDKNSEYMIKPSCNIKTVSVRGAESDMYKIAYAKVIVDATNITKAGIQDYLYQFVDEQENVIPATNILHKSHETLPIEHEVFKKVTVPVKILPDESLNNFGLTVKSQSFTSIDVGVSEGVEISEINAVLKKSDLTPENKCDLSLIVPDGVYLENKNSTVSVTYILDELISAELEIPVELTNVPDGVSAKCVPEIITVTAKGTKDSLSADKIHAKVDFSEAGANAPASVTFETAHDITIIGEYHINIITE